MKPSEVVRFIAGLGDSLDQVIGTLLLLAVALCVLAEMALKVLGKAAWLSGDSVDDDAKSDAAASEVDSYEEEMHDLQLRLKREREEQADRRVREEQDRRACERSQVDEL